MKFGTTFSQKQLRYLDCPIWEALDEAIKLNLDYLRICTYWDEIERTEGKYDWSELEKILNICQKKHQSVVLTLGTKAPRHPEFHFPRWIKNKNLNHQLTQQKNLTFIKKTVKKFKNLSCIKYYQLENEAFDPSGPNNETIPLSFLKRELALVKKNDDKKIILSLWGNELSKRNLLPKLSQLTDIVGIDLYYQQFVGKILNKSLYIGPLDTQQKLSKILAKLSREVWVMELQAEPWEDTQQTYLSPTPKSISPEQIQRFYQKVQRLPVSTVFFWGFEYWYYQKYHNNNPHYLKSIAQIIAS